MWHVSNLHVAAARIHQHHGQVGWTLSWPLGSHHHKSSLNLHTCIICKCRKLQHMYSASCHQLLPAIKLLSDMYYALFVSEAMQQLIFFSLEFCSNQSPVHLHDNDWSLEIVL